MLPIPGTVEFSTFTAISDQERCSVAGPLPLESRMLTYIRLSFEESGLEFHADRCRPAWMIHRKPDVNLQRMEMLVKDGIADKCLRFNSHFVH